MEVPPAVREELERLRHCVAAREAELARKTAELQQRDEQIRQLEHRVKVLERLAFGPKSEKHRPWVPDLALRQGALLFPEFLAAAQRVADATGAVGSIESRIPAVTKRRRGRRKELPEHLLEVRTTYELPPEQRQCCGQAMVEIGEETTRVLERVEISVVHEVVRKKYACRECEEKVVRAPGPVRIVPKGLLGNSFVVHVLVDRFARHMPYHRQEAKYAAEGLPVSRSVLCQAAKESAEQLEPVWVALRDEVLESEVTHTDDTPVTLRYGRGQGRQTGRVWYYGDHAGRCWYDFTPTRSRAGPLRVLGNYRGYVQADAFSGYDALFRPGGATEVGCWAHCRRYFERARDSDPGLAAEALSRIGELYAVEKLARARGLDADGVRQLREQESRPRLEAFADWLLVTRDQVLDKSPMGQAIRYAQGQWRALTRYVEDGRLEIDNNRAERALRAVVTGRKNWLVVGNEAGGRTAAILYSMVQTCKEIGVDPQTYLADVLVRLREGADPPELTPHRWKEKYAAAAESERDWILARLRAALAADSTA